MKSLESKLKRWQILHTNQENRKEGLFGFDKFIEEALKDTVPCRSEAQTMLNCLKHCDLDSGICLELGTYLGRTANALGVLLSALSPGTKLYTIDSFEGLPECWRDGFPRGTFALTEDLRPQLLSNIEQVTGSFEEALPSLLKRLESEAEGQKLKIAFLHIDCDLYSSTRAALEILAPHIVSGTVILFDEFGNYPGWQDGEFKAFSEFLEFKNRKLEVHYLCRNIHHQAVGLKIL
ncbi:MAG: class I SAM-dependent methyltransferase [Cyanobacteriota/Melainabacteria group bacterium]|nr:class I SAM-dependent methyltransferase [Cyanobacteria bacterium HKST-UBA01]